MRTIIGALPGDPVLAHAGVYRERASTARGGEAGRPILYAAAPGDTACLRGSEVFEPLWKSVKDIGKDFNGNRMTKKALLPGRFQDSEIGARNHLTLWPVRGVPCSWIPE